MTLAALEKRAAKEGATLRVESYTAHGARHVWASLRWPGKRDGMREVGGRTLMVEGKTIAGCARQLEERANEPLAAKGKNLD